MRHRVFPNPTAGPTRVRLADCRAGSAVLYDLTGRKRLEFTIEPGEDGVFDAGELEAGIYIARIHDWTGERYSVRVAVMR